MTMLTPSGCNCLLHSAVDTGAVNRVGQQANGEAGRDPLRINSGEAPDMNAMSGNGHMMSPGQEHMRQAGHGGHGGQEGDMRQAGQDTR